MASTFSMEQMIIQLSLVSRTTSISYSFQPIKDSSMSNSLVGERSNPRMQIASNSSRLYAIPPPEPPMVKDGRIMAGKPIRVCTSNACSNVWAISARGHSRPMFFMALSKRFLSSALSIVSASAPIISTLYLSNTPIRFRSSAQFSAV